MPNSVDLLQGTLDLLILRTLCAGAHARLGDLPAHPAGLRGRAAGEPGLALSGAPSAGGAGLDRRPSGARPRTTRRAKFYALTRAGQQAARGGDRQLGAPGRRRRPHPPDGLSGAANASRSASVRDSGPSSTVRRTSGSMDEELRFHLEMETAAATSAAGCAPDEARRAARRELRRRRGRRRRSAASARGVRLLEDLVPGRALRRSAACAATPASPPWSCSPSASASARTPPCSAW